ncbi:16S rRNA (guanine(527)-N(7))-methyltransferase RsmG [Thiolapillus sp.]
MREIWQEQLSQGLAEMGLDVEPRRQALLLDYLQLLQKWNQAFNLTAVRDPQIMVSRQLLDSLSIHVLLRGTDILDVGSGAGLPGIPLAIIDPGRNFTLLDTNGKKTRFQRQVKLDLGLDNIQIVQVRVEQYQPPRLFDVIVSRAFSSLPLMVDLTRKLLAREGCWLAMKGAVPREEMAELAADLRVGIHELRVPGETGQRHAVEICRAI